MNALDGTRWRLVLVPDGSGQLRAVPDEVVATVRFADDTVSGTGGCNRYGGSYRVEGAALSFGPVVATLMHCPGPRGEIERAVLPLLDQVASYAVLDDRLVLRDAAGGDLLVWVAEPQPQSTAE